MDLHQQNSSLKAKFKQCLCFSCSPSSPSTKIQSEENCNHPSKHSSIWIRTREHDLTEIRSKCVNALNRIGHHLRHSSTDFRYDPSSYALNFQDGDDDCLIDEESRLRDFLSRLPASPEKVSREISAFN